MKSKALRVIKQDGEYWVVKGEKQEDGGYPYYDGPYETKGEAQLVKDGLIRLLLMRQVGF